MMKHINPDRWCKDYYWLWIAYEPDMDLCLMMHIYIKRERTIFVYVINSSNRRYGRNLAEEKPYSQRWCSRWYNIMMLVNDG
jgi:hypothetical protein